MIRRQIEQPLRIMALSTLIGLVVIVEVAVVVPSIRGVMILVGIVMPFSDRGWQIVNAAFLAIAVAEAVRLAVIILSYRRGWHG